MRFYLTRQYDMLYHVSQVLKKHEKAIITRVPVMSEIIADFSEHVSGLRKLKTGGIYVVKISTGRKRSVRGELTKHILKLQGIVRAHQSRSKPGAAANVFDLPENASPANSTIAFYSPSVLRNAGSEKLCRISRQIIDEAKKISKAHRYGLTAGDIRDAEFLFDEFSSMKNAPKERRKEIASRNEELALGIKEAIYSLENTIDPLMAVATEENTDLRNRYASARKVLPRGQGRISEKEERYRKSRKRKTKKRV